MMALLTCYQLDERKLALILRQPCEEVDVYHSYSGVPFQYNIFKGIVLT